MSALFTAPSLLLPRTPVLRHPQHPSLSYARYPSRTFVSRFSSSSSSSSSSSDDGGSKRIGKHIPFIPNKWGEKPDHISVPEPDLAPSTAPDSPIGDIEDEWGKDKVSSGPSGVIAGAANSLFSKVKNEAGRVGSVASKTVAGASDVISGASGVVTGAADSAIHELKDESGRITRIASDVVTGEPGSAIGEIKDESGRVKTTVTNVVTGASDVLEGAADSTVREIKDESGRVIGVASGVVAGASGVIDGAANAAIREIKDESGRVIGTVSGIAAGVSDVIETLELKRTLVHTAHGTDFGFRASTQVRAKISELVTKIEKANPNPNPTEVPAVLDGTWVLVYTAYSELLPLLAVGSTPLLKLEKITQAIDSRTKIVENSCTLYSGFLTFSFSASASFEVQSPSRIQVRFKEATFKPPAIEPRLDIPENVEILGQKITLSPAQQLLHPVQQVLNPVQDAAAASVSQTLFGLPSLKVPIPGERTQSWLLISYVDNDLRISRGDGGLFVHVKQGSLLL